MKARLELLVLLLLTLSGMRCVERADPPELVALLQSTVSDSERTVLVVGDSLTEYSDGFYLEQFLGPEFRVYHRGVINKDYAYWTAHLEEALNQSRTVPPGQVIVALGTNDAFYLGPDAFLSAVASFDSRLRQDHLGVVYYCLMPRTGLASLVPAIAANNAALRSNPPANSILIDLEQVFDAAPAAPLLYLDSDPVHPTDAGYRLIGRRLERSVRFAGQI
ncbi:MAG: SGNH/GDSL hydrolase family protein [Spirochaetales bacterium]|nr:SGNH/GDSL hydrolase family protein [Leptospiraceae bacterium]MCP5482631.1 SGNH/GDSL hydrolase family protein [Spirochaetales bacterium]MCP5485012.1 SGNH/GDSL hydrolase family protein [Spirochaetales bacterium]